MEYSKDGSFDEVLALDRYVVSEYDGFEKGNTVVFPSRLDEDYNSKQVGVIESVSDNNITAIDRKGRTHTVEDNVVSKALETKPSQLWERWSKGAASVEPEAVRDGIEDDFRWLFDGYRYSPGGRIQLMLGQEHVTGEKAPLTAYNCFVIESPEEVDGDKEQFLEVLDKAYYEASIMRRGGGVGLNIGHIKNTKGAPKKKYTIHLDTNHDDSQEFLERIEKGKFKGVYTSTNKKEVDSNTYIIAPEDSVDGLFEAMNILVENAYQEWENIIIDFSNLRPRNAVVKGVNGHSSGSVSWAELFVIIANLLQQDEIDNVDFAEIYSTITNLIEQGGSRRGALMLVNDIDNSNVKKFIQRKKTAGFLEGANISVGITDPFMDDVKNQNPESLEVWDLVIESAWGSAEPGIVWLDRANKESNSWYYNQLRATNPCGEQFLPKWGVCNLGHFVLSRFYDEETKDVNWDDLKKATKTAVRFQDNVIDYTDYFLEENEAVQKAERRIGVGTMGLGTLMIKLGLRYGSEEGNKFIDKLYHFIAVEEYKASIDLAEEKGAFPEFVADKMAQSGFMKRLLPELPKEYQYKFFKTGIRNVTINTQAPTGSTGTMIDNIPLMRDEFGGSTTGIEPYFSWSYYRASRLGVVEQVVPIAKDYMDAHGLTDVADLPEYFVTAMDLTPMEHVSVQAAIQKWTDSSISKTANVPSDFTVEETKELYVQAYEMGLKGVTIYRDGSRDTQVLAANKEDAKLGEDQFSSKKRKTIDESAEQEYNDIKRVPSRLFGLREKTKYQGHKGMSKAYIHIYVDEDDAPIEVWISPTDPTDVAMADALGRMITQFLRFGATTDNVEQTIKHLTKGQPMMSLPYKVGTFLSEIHYGKVELPKQAETVDKDDEIQERVSAIDTLNLDGRTLAKCDECGTMSYDKPNCICYSCGFSSCN